MARCFGESIGEAGCAGGVGCYGDGFHEVGDCDLGAVDGEINWGSGGSVGGLFVKVRVGKAVDHDLCSR